MVAGARIVGEALTNVLKHAGMVETAQQSETIISYRPSGSRLQGAVPLRQSREALFPDRDEKNRLQPCG